MRAFRERILQGIVLEVGGMLLAVPLYSAVVGVGLTASARLLLALTMIDLVWCPLFNLAFDRLEKRATARPACQRPACLRALHALLHETASVLVSVPVIMAVGGHKFLDALAIDLGLIAFYTVYVFGFYLLYDHLRPIARPV